MSKKLKKKIEEICGLRGLDWETRQDRASQILASKKWKDSICNDLQGLSFRDLERTLNGILSERQKKEDSYQRKLDLYNKGKIKKKPMLKDNEKNENSTTKTPPRSLEEILAQVYSPRVVPENVVYDYDWHTKFYWGDNTGVTLTSDHQVSSNSHDGND